MTYLLAGVVAILAVVIIGLIWAWIVKDPRTEQYRSYRAVTTESAMRNRVWDAAVSRARDRVHGPS